LAGSLDWLAALLAMPAPTTSAAPTVPLAAGEPESQGAGDAPLRIAGEAVSAERESAASPPTAAAADGGKASLELAASKLLPPLVGTESGAAAPVAADQEGDSSLQPAVRGAEWFSQAVRQASAPERHAIVTHARDPRWAEEFGVRIALMVRGGESAASLQLSPVDLGPLEVSITVRESQASIHFGAAQAETRSLIEASIPRLREMLAAQGFHLMDASVSQGFARQAQSDGSPAQRRDLDSEPEQQAATRVTATGLLDTYA
jgi:flagellar hook-length control protein FliK